MERLRRVPERRGAATLQLPGAEPDPVRDRGGRPSGPGECDDVVDERGVLVAAPARPRGRPPPAPGPVAARGEPVGDPSDPVGGPDRVEPHVPVGERVGREAEQPRREAGREPQPRHRRAGRGAVHLGVGVRAGHRRSCGRPTAGPCTRRGARAARRRSPARSTRTRRAPGSVALGTRRQSRAGAAERQRPVGKFAVTGAGACGSRLEGLEDDLGDVGHRHLLVLALALHAVVHHHVAEGARDRDPFGAGGDGLLGALDVHLLADRLLHPHARAAGAAAHARVPLRGISTMSMPASDPITLRGARYTSLWRPR